MFASRLAAPFALLALFFLYLAWKVDTAWSLWFVPFLVVAAVIFIFSAEINWWWYNRHPLKLDSALTRLLIRHCGFYQRLDAAGQQRFRERVALFRMGTEWTPMGWPDEMEVLPPDVELALAAQAVTLTFHKPTFLFERFEKVLVYPAPFPSPEYPFPHTSEMYEDDGCLLFSAEHVLRGFTQPGWYNVALHEYARAFVRSRPQEPYPDFEAESIWEKLAAASGMSRKQVESTIGIAGIEALPVAVHHYFMFPEQFVAHLPAEAAALQRVFG